MKNFETAARRGVPAVSNPVDIPFQIDGTDFTAHPPTSGQLALFILAQGQGGYSVIGAMFTFLESILDEDGVVAIREKLTDGVELSLITDIISYLIEEWSARPTKPSSASSGSRKVTGNTSTAKRVSRARVPS